MNMRRVLMAAALVTGMAVFAGAVDAGAGNEAGPVMANLNDLAAMPAPAVGLALDGATNRGSVSAPVGAGSSSPDSAQTATAPSDKGNSGPDIPLAAREQSPDRSDWAVSAGLSGFLAAGYAYTAASCATLSLGAGLFFGAAMGGLFLAEGLSNHDAIAAGVGVGMMVLAGAAMLSPVGAAVAAGCFSVACLFSLEKAIFG